VSPASAILRGASSRVAAVQSVVARVAVDASGLNIDQDVDLEAIDENGASVPGVEVLPDRAHVSIEVARELAYATLPVVPVIVGSPAAGYRVSSVTANPTTLTVSGEAEAVTQLSAVSTQPLDVTGLTDSLVGSVEPDLPADVSVVGDGAVQVQVTIEAETGSQTWQAGVRLEGARANREYALSASTIQVTFGGPAPVLASVDPSTIVAAVDVAELSVGRHEVNVTVTPIEGLDVLDVAPATIRVDVSRSAAASAAPSLPATPSLAPSPTVPVP
jgi:YbbR domain-containing protein